VIFIREKYKEFEVYEGVVVTYGYDCRYGFVLCAFFGMKAD